MEGYKVLDLVGKGGYGVVLKAKDKLDPNGGTVALKMMKTVGQRRKYVRELEKEFKIQKDWDSHPNIVKMLHYFRTDNSLVIVTEYCRGDLRALMSTYRDGYSQSEIIRNASAFSSEIISGLHFIHSKGIIHRDIKLENILIGFDNRPKLGDFGFAKIMGDESIKNMSVKGTFTYMAPEVIATEAYGVKADIWSFGCVLYEFIVGRPVIRASTFSDLANLMGLLQIEFPDYITGNCYNFLKGLLQKDARRRLTWPRLEKHPFLEEGYEDDEGVGDEGVESDGDVGEEQDHSNHLDEANNANYQLQPREESMDFYDQQNRFAGEASTENRNEEIPPEEDNNSSHFESVGLRRDSESLSPQYTLESEHDSNSSTYDDESSLSNPSTPQYSSDSINWDSVALPCASEPPL